MDGKNSKPGSNMCPSSLENGKQRKGRTKGEWGAGAHLVARGAQGAHGGTGRHTGVRRGCKQASAGNCKGVHGGLVRFRKSKSCQNHLQLFL